MSTNGWQRVEQQRHTPTRVLVLGSSGMVGRAWCDLLKRRGIEYTPLQRPEFDLCDNDSIDRAIIDGFELVVNAAAWTDVDGAESEEADATQANAHAVHRIAERCNAAGSMLITYSTDYIFNGKSETPYAIDHAPDPINAYGRSKALGESLLRECTPQHILIRTSWVHAPWGKNFVRTMCSLLREREGVSVVDDQRGRPTSALSIAEGSLSLYEKGALGTWHLTDKGECTWFGLASRVRHELGSSCDVQPCTSDAFPRPAARPAYSTLDITATNRLIGPLPDWESTVAASIA
jgi:dTDP-4-dehydrorhamnose reductase